MASLITSEREPAIGAEIAVGAIPASLPTSKGLLREPARPCVTSHMVHLIVRSGDGILIGWQVAMIGRGRIRKR